MKFLKRFNESQSNDVMLNLATDSMVDIIDKGFEISISEEKSNKAKYYDCLLVNMNDDSHFKWDDLEDDVIKFLELASDAYTIESIEIEYSFLLQSSERFYNSLVVMPSEIKSGKMYDILKSNLEVIRSNLWLSSAGFLNKDYKDDNIFIQNLSFFYY